MGEDTRFGRRKKRILRALLASPDRGWTFADFDSGRPAEAARELFDLLCYLGAVEQRWTSSSPGLYWLTRSGPDCVRMLLDGTRPSGVLATFVREGPRPARDAWLTRRRHRAREEQVRHAPRKSGALDVSPLDYIPRRRSMKTDFARRRGRRQDPG